MTGKTGTRPAPISGRQDPGTGAERVTRTHPPSFEERYRALFDNVPCGVAVFRPTPDEDDYVVVEFNNTAGIIENITKDKVVGKKLTAVFPGVKAFGLIDVLRRVDQTGHPERHPVGLYRDDRLYGWRENYVYKLSTGEIVAVYTDQTEQVKTKEALWHSENRFQSLVASSADHIFMVDRNDRYLFSNDRVGQFNATSGNSLVGQMIDDFYTPELASRYRRLIDHVFSTGETVSFEHELEESDGLHYHIDTLFPVYKDDRVWAVGGVCHDITRIKVYEKELQQKNEQLEKALRELNETQQRFVDQERQRAMSQMACGIAHDFNNFLSLIQGYTDLLLDSPEILDDKPTARRYFSLINAATEDATRIVRRLRQFYRPGDDESFSLIDVAALIENAVALTRPKWDKQTQINDALITIFKEFDHHSRVSGNQTELTEMLTNLIFNAVDAMPRGGALRFITREEGDRVVLAVSDTGQGMDAAIREKCLTPFFTTKGEEGSGLGLAAVQGIVTRHQGHIDIYSEPGHGTTFEIYLPAVSRKDEQEKVFPQSFSSQSTGLKILIVDDEAPLLEMLTDYLKRDNHRVVSATNGIEGIQKFNNGWFDLVITDLAMPIMGGEGLARHIKAIDPDKPVILLTGFGDMLEADDEKARHADMVLSKPLTLAALRGTINQMIIEKKR